MNLLKQMALNAKLRLAKGKYDTVNTKNIMNNYSNYSMNRAKISPQIELKEMNTEIDKNFSEKVFMLLDKEEETFSPLGDLVDINYFQDLSESERERYIFDMADKYNYIKEEYNRTKRYI